MTPRKIKGQQYLSRVKNVIITRSYIDGTRNVSGPLPPPEETQEFLEEKFSICSNRNFRVILVEKLRDYMVFIQVPGEKSECDFFVWRAIFRENELIDLKIPTHDDLGKYYLKLKQYSENIEDHLINAVIKLLRDRKSIRYIIGKYFKNEEEEARMEIKKFLATLKWIGLQEDVNYPPPKYLGSKYTLVVYAMLEIGIPLNKIRAIIRFGK